MTERFHLNSMQRAYQAGLEAHTKGQPRTSHTGWGYRHGKYYGWFLMGYDGKPFVDFYDPYAYGKAVDLFRKELDRNPHLPPLEAVGLAFARYISSRE